MFLLCYYMLREFLHDIRCSGMYVSPCYYMLGNVCLLLAQGYCFCFLLHAEGCETLGIRCLGMCSPLILKAQGCVSLLVISCEVKLILPRY